MATSAQTATALKEWAVVIRAMDEGEQLILLRKGGISEPVGEFRVEQEEFFFFPSYEHQKRHLVKPAFHSHLDAVLAGWAGPTGGVPITHWARVTDVAQITGEDMVARLDPYHIMTRNYAQERLHWNPSKPLNVLFVRAYRLTEPRWIVNEPHYSGCTSWIELEADLDPVGATPVLDDAAYAARVAEIKAALA